MMYLYFMFIILEYRICSLQNFTSTCSDSFTFTLNCYINLITTTTVAMGNRSVRFSYDLAVTKRLFCSFGAKLCFGMRYGIIRYALDNAPISTNTFNRAIIIRLSYTLFNISFIIYDTYQVIA